MVIIRGSIWLYNLFFSDRMLGLKGVVWESLRIDSLIRNWSGIEGL
jgi:hypothetical protein